MKFLLAALILLISGTVYAQETYKPAGSWSISITSGATSSDITPGSLCAGCSNVMLVATVASYVDFTTTATTPAGSGGTSPYATTSFYMPADREVIWDIRPGATISVISDAGGSGTLRITVLSR